MNTSLTNMIKHIAYATKIHESSVADFATTSFHTN